MFRSSIQRQVRLGSSARRQLSTLALRQIRSRPLVASYQKWPQAELQLTPLRQIAIRLYSQESAVAHPETDIENLPGGIYDVNRFEDLKNLGVNERIVRAITQDMGYETMTEVQALTINPALKGTDLYVYYRAVHHFSPMLIIIGLRKRELEQARPWAFLYLFFNVSWQLNLPLPLPTTAAWLLQEIFVPLSYLQRASLQSRLV